MTRATEIEQAHRDCDVVIVVPQEQGAEASVIKHRYSGSMSVGRSFVNRAASMFRDVSSGDRRFKETGIMRIAVIGSRGMELTGGIEHVTPDDHNVDEDFASRLIEDTSRYATYIEVVEETGHFAGFKVIYVKKGWPQEIRFVLDSFVSPGGAMYEQHEKRAFEYAKAAGATLGVEVRS